MRGRWGDWTIKGEREEGGGGGGEVNCRKMLLFLSIHMSTLCSRLLPSRRSRWFFSLFSFFFPPSFLFSFFCGAVWCWLLSLLLFGWLIFVLKLCSYSHTHIHVAYSRSHSHHKHACAREHTHTHTHTVQTYTLTRAHTHASARTHTHTHTHARKRARMHACVHVRAYKYPFLTYTSMLLGR